MFWTKEHLENFDSTALWDARTNESLSYSDLSRQIQIRGEILSAKKKSLVFLFCNNSMDSIINYISILSSGNTVFLADEKMDKILKNNLIELYRPEKIISTEENSVFEGYSKVESKTIRYFEKKDKNIADEIDERLAVLLSTSGTTGSPKLVRLTYDNIFSNAASISEYLSISGSERAITSLPMSYSYGLSIINSHLLKGASIVCSNLSTIMRDFWTAFSEKGCTSFAGVPYNYQMLMKLRFHTMDLSTLKTMTQAGGRLSEEFVKYFYEISRKKEIKFFVMYGQTEATARISYIPYEMLGEKIGSIGIPIPGGNIDIYDGDNRISDSNLIGELVYSGKNVMMGYATSRKCLSKGDELKSILRTGDVGYKDSEGYVFITGRMKRFLKIFGLRLNLDEIEKMLENYFAVPVACLGNDDELKIIIETSSSSLTSQVKQKVIEIYKIHHSVVKVLPASSIPTTSSGKRNYYEMEKM